MQSKQTAPSSVQISRDRWKGFDIVGEVKQEFLKITWTAADELKVYTKVVVGATFFCGMATYLVDLLIQGGLSALNAFFRVLGG